MNLRLNKDGKFRILILSDAHHAPGTGLETIKAMECLIDRSRPDFVLLNGDNIAGHATKKNCIDMIDQIVSPMEDRSIPWAHVYGNHDKTPRFSKQYQQELYEQYPHCLSKSGPEDIPGVGNYFLPVYDKDDKIAFGIWALDSMQDLDIMDKPLPYKGNFEKDVLLPQRLTTGSDADWIRFEQVQWYYNYSKKIEKENGRKIPSIMCFHQPLYEFNAIIRNPIETKMTGECNEKISCSEVSSGLFAATLQRSDILGIFCGHDHINTFDGVYCNTYLGYCGSVGYHAYGLKNPTEDRERLRGGRIIDFDVKTPWQIKTSYILTKED
ncbi:MAG: metallophosphoesterase family protein [Sphaerochaetaceae bacterium]|nr:metallophosphoesterase family protein [Sphaerochaetaceae bacterium]